MPEWLLFAIAGIAGGLTNEIFRRIQDHIEKPYRWTCKHKGCRFRVSANDEDILNKLVEVHDHYWEGREKERWNEEKKEDPSSGATS